MLNYLCLNLNTLVDGYIQYSPVRFTCLNVSIIDFQKPGGIIALLDEAWYVWIFDHQYPLIFIHLIENGDRSNHWLRLCDYFLSHFSVLPRSTNDTFAQKLYQTFKDHKRFSKPKLARSDFTICHYAGDVWTISSWWPHKLCWFHFKTISLHVSFLISGHVSNRVFLGQEQRLCCCRASISFECFQMFFRIQFISTFVRWLIQIFKVFINRLKI